MEIVEVQDGDLGTSPFQSRNVFQGLDGNIRVQVAAWLRFIITKASLLGGFAPSKQKCKHWWYAQLFCNVVTW
jgi:hypothetical protein